MPIITRLFTQGVAKAVVRWFWIVAFVKHQWHRPRNIHVVIPRLFVGNAQHSFICYTDIYVNPETIQKVTDTVLPGRGD